MEVDPWFYEAGLWGLFLACFLSATFLPFASELVLIACLSVGYSLGSVLIIASVGNTMGGLLTYALGRAFTLEKASKLLRMDARKVLSWSKRIKNNAPWWALLCWLPFIGDFIALGLGTLRASPMLVTVFMFLGKALRYAVLIVFWKYKFG